MLFRSHDLVLSVDARLQSVAEKALQDYNGAIVVMDPNTGRSEERRVGKECRCGWAASEYEEKHDKRHY